MQVLLETLLQLTEEFEPITSAQILAFLGFLALVYLVVRLMIGLRASAIGAMLHLFQGAGRLVLAVVLLVAMLAAIYGTYALVSRALEHILH